MPSDRPSLLVIYGRKPVLEALEDATLDVRRLHLAEGARGEAIDRILAAARARGLRPRRAHPAALGRIGGNPRQDQGVVAEIMAPGLGGPAEFASFLARPGRLRLIALDGITTQDNAGMILRSALAAGFDAACLGAQGTAKLDPRVIKASAGAALRLPIFRDARLTPLLDIARQHEVNVIGLDGAASDLLHDIEMPQRLLLIVGSESGGLGEAARAATDGLAALPMAPGAESLNAACAATLACFVVSHGLRPHSRGE